MTTGPTHEGMIEAIAAAGITQGCTPSTYCPADPVTRAQMATFLDRALDLPDGPDSFSDDTANTHEASINAIAAAGITLGCGSDAYCPDAPVTRAEMASFLQRAFALDDGPDIFDDDTANTHEAAINAVAAAGITLGCDADQYCPDNPVTRAQMASFLGRALDLAPIIPDPRDPGDPGDPTDPDGTCWPDRIPADQVFWATDHEQGVDGELGGLSDWWDNDAEYPGGGMFNDVVEGDDWEVFATDEIAHTCTYSVSATIIGAENDTTRAVRLMRWLDEGWDQAAPDDPSFLPDDAYYSAWFYFPEFFEPIDWWNIFQFKSTAEPDGSNDPVFTLNVDSDPATQTMWLYWWTKEQPGGSLGFYQDDPLPLPIGAWVHIEVHYEARTDTTGRVILYQDGVEILDVDNVITHLGDRLYWGIGNYTDDIRPSTATIYVDDAVISHSRAWSLAGS